MRLASLLPPLLLFATTTNALSAEWNPFHVAKRGLTPLVNRQAGNKNDAQDGTSSVAQKTTDGQGNNNAKATESGSSTQKGKGTITTGSDKKATTTSKYETTKTFNDILPAGGVSLITPAAILGPQYYKIGNQDVTEFVTFAWNFTSLSVTPSAVDVMASCALNSMTYTIALNQSISGPTQTVLWDTGEYERTASVPLAVATYTLIVYDSDSSPNAVARAGYLGTYNQYTFGLYTPRAPVPLQGIVCATCGAASSMDKHTVTFLLSLVGVTVFSFGWFTGVAGIW